jgi:outer membrane receptor protein involved in Fe transport
VGEVDRADHSAGVLFLPGGYTTMDLLVDAALTPRLRVNAGLLNIADHKYWAWSDVSGRFANNPALDRYTRAERSAGVTIRYSW